ncbi:hypothetical protein COOONC_01506 [Cooperia oncophora]
MERRCYELYPFRLSSVMNTFWFSDTNFVYFQGDEAKWTATIQHHYAEFCVSSAGKPMDTFTLALPSVGVNGEYTVDKEGTAPATNKALLYREGGYLKVTITLGQVNHSFTTDLLNQILFAEQSFRSELSALITRIRAERYGWLPVSNHAPQTVSKEPMLLFSLMVKGQGVPWLQLTAATPTATAVRFTIESLDAELTNRWVGIALYPWDSCKL